MNIKDDFFITIERDFSPKEKGSLNSIATHNMWSFDLNKKDYKLIGKEKIVVALKKVSSLMSSKWSDKECIFYCWFDEMAGRIYFSTIPRDSDLPFGCNLNIVRDIGVIVNNALIDSTGFLEEISIEEAFEDSSSEDNYILDVFVKNSGTNRDETL